MDLRSIAVDSSAGRFLYVSWQALRGGATSNEYRRAGRLLAAWRASDSAVVGRYVQERVLTEYGVGMVPLRDNRILKAYIASPEAHRVRSIFSGYPMDDRVRMREPRNDDDPSRQGDLIVLKPYIIETGEKGVLLIKYTESFARFAALFRIEELIHRYVIVLEPSWWGYQDVDFLLLAGSDTDVVVQAPSARDFAGSSCRRGDGR